MSLDDDLADVQIRTRSERIRRQQAGDFGGPWESAEHRYQNDVQFAWLVNSLAAAIDEGRYTQDDLLDAARLAVTYHEARRRSERGGS